MKKMIVFIVLNIILTAFSAAGAEDTVLAVDLESYMCGDVLEIMFPEVPSTSSMVSNASQVQAVADPDERLLQVRITLQNKSTSLVQGISKDNFSLTGYVRDRSVTYKPEMVLNTDYFGSGNYYELNAIPPMRMIDVLLIYRVKPTLVNYELTIDTSSASLNKYEMQNVSYPLQSTGELCKGTFQFQAIRTLETGLFTRYDR